MEEKTREDADKRKWEEKIKDCPTEWTGDNNIKRYGNRFIAEIEKNDDEEPECDYDITIYTQDGKMVAYETVSGDRKEAERVADELLNKSREELIDFESEPFEEYRWHYLVWSKEINFELHGYNNNWTSARSLPLEVAIKFSEEILKKFKEVPK